MSIENMLARLDKVKETGPGTWLACCPAHDDKHPSLSIRETDDGTILLKCWAGCGANDVVEVLGMTFSDLFPDRNSNSPPLKPHEKWPPRDVIRALREESMVMVIAGSAIVAGEKFTEEDNERVLLAACRFHAAAREVGYD